MVDALQMAPRGDQGHRSHSEGADCQGRQGETLVRSAEASGRPRRRGRSGPGVGGHGRHEAHLGKLAAYAKLKQVKKAVRREHLGGRDREEGGRLQDPRRSAREAAATRGGGERQSLGRAQVRRDPQRDGRGRRAATHSRVGRLHTRRDSGPGDRDSRDAVPIPRSSTSSRSRRRGSASCCTTTSRRSRWGR